MTKYELIQEYEERLRFLQMQLQAKKAAESRIPKNVPAFSGYQVHMRERIELLESASLIQVRIDMIKIFIDRLNHLK
ncbi:MAG: hypothetical protein GWN62_12950 [Aliifodinibius sp.]|nr:hypothetical protein [Fodinibius sp.]